MVLLFGGWTTKNSYTNTIIWKRFQVPIFPVRSIRAEARLLRFLILSRHLYEHTHSSVVLLRFYLAEPIYWISIAFHAIRVVPRYHRYHQYFLLAMDNVLSALAQWIIPLKFVLSFEMYTLYMLHSLRSFWHEHFLLHERKEDFLWIFIEIIITISSKKMKVFRGHVKKQDRIQMYLD